MSTTVPRPEPETAHAARVTSTVSMDGAPATSPQAESSENWAQES